MGLQAIYFIADMTAVIPVEKPGELWYMDYFLLEETLKTSGFKVFFKKYGFILMILLCLLGFSFALVFHFADDTGEEMAIP